MQPKLMTPREIFQGSSSGDWLDSTLCLLLKEPLEAVIERERVTFDKIAEPFEHSLVLFGCGQLGRSTLQGLRQCGVEPLCFADNNSRLWGTVVDGVPVLAPDEAVARYGQRSCFVVTIFHASAVAHQLDQLQCPRVSGILPLFWKYSDIFVPSFCVDLPHNILMQESAIRRGYSALSDDPSRREFCEQLWWRVRFDANVLSPYLDERHIYFPDDLVLPLDDELFVDCGGFDGDSVRSFLSHRHNRFGKIFVVEPDRSNLRALDAWVASTEPSIRSRIQTLPYAVSDEDGAVSFRSTSSAASTILCDAAGATTECRKLDTLFPDDRLTYIKMDIEGAEPKALIGAAAILPKSKPVLAVCVYHRWEHMWEIPRVIKSLNPDYEVFLRRYAEDCWELVCYAIPPGRLRARG